MTSMDEVKKVVFKFNSKKSSTYGAIPAKILKQTIEIYLEYLTNTINHPLNEFTFPDILKQSEVIPVHKKFHPLQKENYRPMSLLPNKSKVFERIIYKQIKSQNVFCVSGNNMAHNIV